MPDRALWTERSGAVPFRLDWEPRGVFVTYSGTLLAEEVLECHRQIASDPRFDDLRFAIVDTLPVQSVLFSRSDVEQINALLLGPAWTNPNIRVLFVATRADVLQVLSCYDAIDDRSYEEVICASAEAAREVIARSPPLIRPRGSPKH